MEKASVWERIVQRLQVSLEPNPVPSSPKNCAETIKKIKEIKWPATNIMMGTMQA